MHLVYSKRVMVLGRFIQSKMFYVVLMAHIDIVVNSLDVYPSIDVYSR
jgi:hypothetical protein